MIEARAVVERVEGGHAWVRVRDRGEGCGRCDEPGGCRATRIAHVFRQPNEVFRLHNEMGARAGDAVVLRLRDGAALRGALASYGLGALLLLAGAALGAAMGQSASQTDAWALAGGAAGLALAWLINRGLTRSRRWRAAFRMEMVKDTTQCGLTERGA